MTLQIILGDCREVLATLPDESVDAVLADPPYEQTALRWDRWPDGWPAAVRRVLKRTGTMWVFGSLRMFLDRRDEFDGWSLAQDVIWEKHNGSSFHADRFRRVHEQVVQFYRSDAVWADVYKAVPTTSDAVRRQIRRKQRPAHMGTSRPTTFVSHDGGPRLMRSVIEVRSCHGYAEHPTQKPKGILEPLLLNACPPGGVVLDPFFGSGSTGLVASRLSMRCIGIELNPEYAALAPERIARDGGMFASFAEAAE